MTERINDLDLCDVLALASDYLDVAYLACQSLGKDDAGPLLLVLGDAGRALDKAKAEMDTRGRGCGSGRGTYPLTSCLAPCRNSIDGCEWPTQP